VHLPVPAVDLTSLRGQDATVSFEDKPACPSPRGSTAARPATLGTRPAILLGLLALFGSLVSCANVNDRIMSVDPGGSTGTLTGLVASFDETTGTLRPLVGLRVEIEPGTARGITNAAGRYTISNVVAGAYILSAAGDGFYSAVREVQVLPNSSTNGDLILAPSGETGAIAGHVTVDGINGIGGVTVSSLPPSQVITTTPDGVFALPALPPGLYTVRAERDGYLPDQERVIVQGGQVAISRLNVTPRTDGTISGSVSDGVNPVGDSLATVRISLLYGAQRETITRPQATRPEQVRAGQFPLPFLHEYEFSRLQTGRYVVMAVHPEFAPGSKEIDVIPPRPANGDVILSRDGQTGAVTGTIFDPSDFPEAGAVVSIGLSGMPSIKTTVTGLDGRYFFAELTPGLFDVSVVASVFTTQVLDVLVTAGHTADGSLKIEI